VKTLVGQIEAVFAQFSGAPFNTWDVTQLGGYEILSSSSNAFKMIGSGYIDVAGLSMDQKTVLIEQLSLQYQFPPFCTNGVPGDAISISIIVADVPVDEIDHIGPGFAGSTMSAQNCFIHRVQNWVVTVDSSAFGSNMAIESETITGLAAATTSDRIYYSVVMAIETKVVGPDPPGVSTLDSVTFPGVRVVLGVGVKEESEYVYLMRQRRAYELQQEPDVD